MYSTLEIEFSIIYLIYSERDFGSGTAYKLPPISVVGQRLFATIQSPPTTVACLMQVRRYHRRNLKRHS